MINAVDKAIVCCANAHFGQIDKEGLPYFWHPIRVAQLLKAEGDMYQVIGLLHDVVEDTEATIQGIEREFGAEIACHVGHLTRPYGVDYQDYIERIKKCPVCTKVKLADLEDNLYGRSTPNPTERDHKRQQKYEAAKEYLRL